METRTILKALKDTAINLLPIAVGGGIAYSEKENLNTHGNPPTDPFGIGRDILSDVIGGVNIATSLIFDWQLLKTFCGSPAARDAWTTLTPGQIAWIVFSCTASLGGQVYSAVAPFLSEKQMGASIGVELPVGAFTKFTECTFLYFANQHRHENANHVDDEQAHILNLNAEDRGEYQSPVRLKLGRSASE